MIVPVVQQKLNLPGDAVYPAGTAPRTEHEHRGNSVGSGRGKVTRLENED